MTDSVDKLYQAVVAAKNADPSSSRTARLIRAGRAKMAKKLAEEAVEVAIDAMHGSRDAVVRESADLLYNLVVLWVSVGRERRVAVLRELERLDRAVASKWGESVDVDLALRPDRQGVGGPSATKAS